MTKKFFGIKEEEWHRFDNEVGELFQRLRRDGSSLRGSLDYLSDDEYILTMFTVALFKSQKRLEKVTWVLIALTTILAILTGFLVFDVVS
ncbi:MAG: hypothetical protein HY664_06240 [Chloroflexi bacterium]|nr:hypothetical protein [Chloroflexota bacterium]